MTTSESAENSGRSDEDCRRSQPKALDSGAPILNNEWTRGAAQLVFPPLPEKMRGGSGCLLHEANFDATVGREVCVIIREDSAFCDTLAGIPSIEVSCRPRLVATNHGIIILLIFVVHDPTQIHTLYEVFLNPYRQGPIDLLSRWSRQTHLKVILFDSDNDVVRRWFEFDNNYGINEFLATTLSCVHTELEGDFHLARQEFMATHSMNDLLEM